MLRYDPWQHTAERFESATDRLKNLADQLRAKEAVAAAAAEYTAWLFHDGTWRNCGNFPTWREAAGELRLIEDYGRRKVLPVGEVPE